MGMHEETWFTYAIECDHCGFLGPSAISNQTDAEVWAEKFGFLKLPFTGPDGILHHWFCPNCKPFLSGVINYDGRYWHHFLD